MEEIIKLTNENGEEEEFEIIATFGLDDEMYAALMPTEDEEELILMLKIVEEDDDNIVLMGIDDEEELNDVIDAFEELQIED